MRVNGSRRGMPGVRPIADQISTTRIGEMKKKLVADEKKKVADVAAVTQHAQPASSSPPAAVSTPMPEPVAVVPEPEPVAVPVAGPDGRRRAIIEARPSK